VYSPALATAIRALAHGFRSTPLKRTALITHGDCLLHAMLPGHPECPERLSTIERQLAADGLLAALVPREAPLATQAQLERVHDAAYVRGIFSRSPAHGLVELDPDTWMGPHSLNAALRAAGGVVLATELVIGGQVANAFCNVRPPGHHAERAQAMGFCLFNSIAVGAAHALDAHGLERVAVIDFDVHHGNGTEAIFRDEPRVLMCSTYQYPLYPYVVGLMQPGHMVNVPLSPGAGGNGTAQGRGRAVAPGARALRAADDLRLRRIRRASRRSAREPQLRGGRLRVGDVGARRRRRPARTGPHRLRARGRLRAGRARPQRRRLRARTGRRSVRVATLGPQSETGRLRRVLLKPPAAAFVDAQRIEHEWRDLGYTAPPRLERAIDEHARFAAMLEAAGTQVCTLPPATGTGLDSLYVRDSTVTSARGVILCHMGKPARRGEPRAIASALDALGIPIRGEIAAPGTLEGGDVVWLDAHDRRRGAWLPQQRRGHPAAAVPCSTTRSRSSSSCPFPTGTAPASACTVMSLLSPVDRDLAVVYSPLLSVPFRETLLARGIELVDVPEAELASQGTNVLALGPRHCVMLAGNPQDPCRARACRLRGRDLRGRRHLPQGRRRAHLPGATAGARRRLIGAAVSSGAGVPRFYWRTLCGMIPPA
jgi:N-dimethylarginine dimethylaminohydrolase